MKGKEGKRWVEELRCVDEFVILRSILLRTLHKIKPKKKK